MEHFNRLLSWLSRLDFRLIIAFCALAVSVYAAYISKKRLRIFKWNQVNKTFDFIEMWFGDHITNVRMQAREYFDYEKTDPINMDNLLKLQNYKEVSTLFITLLNYFDVLSLAILKNAVDPQICYNYFGNVLINHYLIFLPFIKHLRGHLDLSDNPSLMTHGHLQIVAERWIDKMQSESKILKTNMLNVNYYSLEKDPIYQEKK